MASAAAAWYTPLIPLQRADNSEIHLLQNAFVFMMKTLGHECDPDTHYLINGAVTSSEVR